MAAVSVADTGWGWAGLAATSEGLLVCTWPWEGSERAEEAVREQLKRFGVVPEPGPCDRAELLARQAAASLLAFFAGDPVPLGQFPLALSFFSPWQRKVYAAVREIPFGEVRSYGWVAARCGAPGAGRAVGSTLRANPVLLFVPCHRVVRGSGDLGGYGGSPELKARLLALERAWLEGR